MRELTSELYGLGDNDLNEFLKTARDRINSAGETFSAHTKNLGDARELMAQANEHLAALALRQHAVTKKTVARQVEIEAEKRTLETRNQVLQEQAVRDPLTTLHNRGYFDEVLRCEIERCRQTASQLGVLFSDIDKFKTLNDTYGHQFGDLVLARIAKVFASVTRSSDVVARYGGEEFVVLARQTSEKGIERLAERIRAAIESESIEFEGERVQVTVSVGAAIAIPRRGETEVAARLIASADEAMYDAKRNGRNQVHTRSLVDPEESELWRRVVQCHFSRWLVRNEYFDIPTISRTLLDCPNERVRIGELAQQLNLMTPSQVDEVLAKQEATNERFGVLAAQFGFLTENQLVRILALQQETPDSLAHALVQRGLLEPDAAAKALDQYTQEIETETRLNPAQT